MAHMKLISDLYMHSKYARGCSTNLDIDHVEKYAKIKGIDLFGTGDFTHPKWVEEVKSKLNEENGVLTSANGQKFIWQTELALVYSQGGRGYRIHNVVLAPSYEVVRQITDYLLKKGRVDYDGRPIFGISCVDFVEEMNNISKDIEVIPAHIWTPWFGLFGSKGGFDNIKDCFQDQLKNIHALETGLSSDPAMNWRLSQLDDFNLVSFSDSHSYWPWRLGREATVIDVKELTYKNILEAIRGKGIKETIEVDPNFGKYHLTGHRKCNVCLEPAESKKIDNKCPKCKRELTVGVIQRVEELADRPEGYKKENGVPYKIIIPLSEILAAALRTTVATKKVWAEYYKLVSKERSEYDVLLNLSKDELGKLTDPRIVEIILKNREGKIEVKGGYDGVYGVPQIEEIKLKNPQKNLGEF